MWALEQPEDQRLDLAGKTYQAYQTADSETREQTADKHHLLVHGGGLENASDQEHDRSTGN